MDYIPFIAREPTFIDRMLMILQYPINLVRHPLEALLSIPALSVFVIPVFSSYSTTFNFLFFYLTWAILIRSNNPLKVELLGTLGIRLMFYVLPSLGSLLFDGAAPQLAQNLKEHRELALATGEKQGGRRGGWWKITLISIFNLFLGIAMQTLTELLLTRILHVRSALRITTTPPFPWSVVKDLFFGLVLRELLTYALHRYVLHSSKSSLRNLHMAWQHSIVSPFSLVAHYDHPVAYLIHIFLPMFIPAVVLRMHLLTFHMYLAVVSLEETFVYSGYNVLPSALVLGGIARRQERHIMGQGAGNYGCIGLTDLMLGTTLGSDLAKDVVDEAGETQVGANAKGKAKHVKQQTQDHLADQDVRSESEATDEIEQDREEPENKESEETRDSDTGGGNDSNTGQGEQTRRHASRGKDAQEVEISQPHREDDAKYNDASNASRKPSSRNKESRDHGEETESAKPSSEEMHSKRTPGSRTRKSSTKAQEQKAA